MDEFEATGGGAGAAERSNGGESDVRLVAMRVGDAEVYVEAVGPPPEVVLGDDDEWEAVGGLNPADAFEKASDALRECVHIVGDKLDNLGDKIAPDEIGVEFTITFDVEGQARIIPVLLTGKAKTAMGVKVSAIWKPGERANAANGANGQGGAK